MSRKSNIPNLPEALRINNPYCAFAVYDIHAPGLPVVPYIIGVAGKHYRLDRSKRVCVINIENAVAAVCHEKQVLFRDDQNALRLFQSSAEANKAVAAAYPKAKRAPKKVEGEPELPEEELPEPEEIYGAAELTKLAQKLASRGLDVADWHLEPRQDVGAEKPYAKFTVAANGDSVDVAGVSHILLTIRRLGQKGMDIQRFKGLGEMNAEQLWQTTMNPERRMLKQVLIEEAGEAEHIFSVLMGTEVEPRREFIERHALEVRNLDV